MTSHIDFTYPKNDNESAREISIIFLTKIRQGGKVIMIKDSKKNFSRFLVSTTGFVLLFSLFLFVFQSTVEASAPPTISLQILETTDLHSNVRAYDYYKDAPDPTFGLAKTATLIKEAKQENPNTLLFDAGDLIQGNPLADYTAKNLGPDDIHPMIEAMNILEYDAATLGNHEFNYGLDYLNTVMSKANHAVVNANIYDAETNENLFKPYEILEKTFVDSEGNPQQVNVGVIGFAPTQIMDWDKDNLEGKVYVEDMVATANKFIPQMEAEGADIIIALAHSGCDVASAGQAEAENAVFDLSQVPGIDALLFGHRHVNFPGAAEFDGNAAIDNVNGTINGVPALEAGFWGNNLGVMNLTLKQDANGRYTIVENPKSSLRPIYDSANGQSLAEEDPEIVAAVNDYHEGTLEYIRSKIGETAIPMNSYFARVQDDPTVQIVNNAQTDFAKTYIKKNYPEDSEYQSMPILSAAAPFKSGRGGVNDYTYIEQGELSLKSANDLYLFNNTFKAVELTGAEVKEWLEMSASQFYQIDPGKSEAQALIDTSFPGYNFDVIDGVTYQIDVTQPAKYSKSGALIDSNASRIKNLEYNGQPVDPNQKFIVATNNYRASGGGHFPGLEDSKLVIDTTIENRNILTDYIKKQGVVSPTPDNNWSIAQLPADVKATFESAPAAKNVLPANPAISFEKETDIANVTWGTYSINTNYAMLVQEQLAEEAVIKAENSRLQEDVDDARALVNALDDSSTRKPEFNKRLDAVQEQINVIAAATAAVVKAENSQLQSDIDAARVLVNALPDGSEKKALVERLNQIVVKIDSVTTQPAISSKPAVMPGTGDPVDRMIGLSLVALSMAILGVFRKRFIR